MIQLKSSFILEPIASSLINRFIRETPLVYTKEDTLVWEKMVKNVARSFSKYARFIYPPFEEGFWNLRLDNLSIPDLNTINQKLNSIGWQAFYVTGFVPAGIYALMLATQIFPVLASLRPLKYFDYSAAPDFAHDVLGHLPMLFVKEFRELLKKWAIKASQCKVTFLDEEIYRLTAVLIKEKEEEKPDPTKIKILTQNLSNIYDQFNAHPSDLSILSKYYGWSFEFGVMKVNESPNIFGAAIVSSSKETQNICEGKAVLLKFNEEALKTGVNYTSLQEKLFMQMILQRMTNYLNDILIEKNE